MGFLRVKDTPRNYALTWKQAVPSVRHDWHVDDTQDMCLCVDSTHWLFCHAKRNVKDWPKSGSILIFVQCVVVGVQMIHHLDKPPFGILQGFVINNGRQFLFK